MHSLLEIYHIHFIAILILIFHVTYHHGDILKITFSTPDFFMSEFIFLLL